MRSHICLFFLLSCALTSAQNTGFTHAQGNRILDNEGNNIIFRGIGTGNWMLQEGYMMGVNGATNGTMWHFRQKLTATIGAEKTNEFFEKWYDCHFSKVDVDSMKAWGFNSVRPALHYKVFTLPIEEEPVAGQDTWLESGFVRLDSLVSWCAQNRMYCILDMHGCPGAQGSDSNISDYDSSKPSLWQSEENKRKLVALWRKIAQRYADSPWIGAYDLINEPKWDALQANANADLWALLKRIITAIREVDTNHLCFLAGNSWGNDYSGLPDLSSWGGNIGLSFHKYWNYNEAGAIDWIVNRGNALNVPVWLGETGENSNSWFADCIRICESKNVGWAFWPVKKMGGNNILRVKAANSNYSAMLNDWRSNPSAYQTSNVGERAQIEGVLDKIEKISAAAAYNGVMQFAEDHKLEHCRIQYDVIDAMIRRPHSDEPRPCKEHDITKEIFAVDYDFGPVNAAYFDVVDADYHSASGTYTSWNSGGQYRNDGVDIQTGADNVSNGYSVGWIEDGEWLHYTLPIPEAKVYNVQLRYSSQAGGGRVYLEMNGIRASRTVDLPATGSWTSWGTVIIPNVLFPAGKSSPLKGDIFPSTGNVFPSMGELSPSMGELSPSMGELFPSMGELFPSMGELFPSMGEYFPSMGELFPSMGELFPSMGELFPSMGKHFLEGKSSSPTGNAKMKIVFEKGGCNFNWFKLVSPQDAALQKFEVLHAETDRARNQIKVFFNQGIKQVETGSFTVTVDGGAAAVTAVEPTGAQEIVLHINKNIWRGNDIRIGYANGNCVSNIDKPLEAFANRAVENRLARHAVLPAKVEAEDYAENAGFQFQECTDTGGGENAGYTDAGDYLEYVVQANYTGKHGIDFRVAVNVSVALMSVQRVGDDGALTVLKNVRMNNTGGWQSWRTVGDTIALQRGKNIIRLTAITEGYNLNWFEIKEAPDGGVGVGTVAQQAWKDWNVYPNPVRETLRIEAEGVFDAPVGLFLYNMAGQLLVRGAFRGSLPHSIDMSRFPAGLYILKIRADNSIIQRKINHIN